jgi:PAS domain S-box-containing protein
MRIERVARVTVVGPDADAVGASLSGDFVVSTVATPGALDVAADLETADAVVVTDVGREELAEVLAAVRAVEPTLPVVAYAPVAAVPLDHVVDDPTADVVPPGADTPGRALLVSRVRAATTAHQRAEDLQLVERAFDDAPVGITVSDPDQTDNPLVYVSEGFARLTGYDAAFAVGRNCRFLQGPDTDPDIVAEVRAAVDEARPVDVEMRNYREDGTPFWNHLRIRPLFDDEGALEYFVGYQQNVTEQVAARREAERRRDELAALASVLSHDVRNPLNVATGHAEALRDGDADPATAAGAVVDSLARIEEILSDALVLVRGDVDSRETVSLSAVAREAWDEVATADATLTVEEDLRFDADRSLLAQLLENLFANSVEHGATDGSVVVTALADGFAVADDGPGVPPDERDAVFDPGVTTSADGTGLGLGIVERVAEAHDWRVEMGESDAGGARVVVSGVDPVEGS